MEQPDRLTYAELSEQSESLARRLAAADAGRGSIVGVHLERTPQYLTAILAVLKCGGAFMPLDPRYPRGRLDFMIQDSGARLLITDSRLVGNIRTNLTQTILLDEEPGGEHDVPRDANFSTTPETLAYVVYTSGSSGKPKGVLCPQLGLLNRIQWMSHEFPYQPDEIASQIVALSFVDSVYEIFGPLLQGVELRMIPDQTARGSPMELMRAISRNRITRIIVVPSVLASWLDCIASLDPNTFPLRYCFVSGEVFPASLAKRFHEILPSTRLINFYGSSELCHHATWFEVADAVPEKTVPIGRPIAATEAYVLDSSRNAVPNGSAGELYMGGPGMARGYLNRLELTAERFIENPFGAPGTRLFKTADLCRFLEDGNLEYLGRIDQQLKIRGCLVEPAEVEAALKKHPGVKDALAGAREDGAGEKKLVAWVILRKQGSLAAGDLRRFLETSLPAHLVPSQFMFLPDFPRLPNNKLNRGELPNPFLIRSQRSSPDRPPQDGIEKRLADLWKTILKTGPLDRNDDFFSLGADSLQTMRLIAVIEERFGVMISIQTLLESPTLAQLAAAIEHQRSSIYPQSIVPLQPCGSRLRFFCFGAGPALKPLAAQLGSDQPFFGITLDERDASWLEGGVPLEEMVRRMLPSLRQFQPDGPYCLGGYSMHGLFAYEAARQLQAQGQEVAALILIDSYLPAGARDSCPVWMRAGSHLSSLGHEVAQGDPQSLLRHVKSLSSQGGSYFRRKLRKGQSAADVMERDTEPALARLLSAAEAAYMPQTYRGCITLLETRDQLLGAPAGARFGWEHLSGAQLEIRTVPGDHNTMLQHPNVTALAGELAARMERAANADPARLHQP